ncbi:hypothetical protein SteCoe_20207 [Stentor coeruleus]|uniref:Uncharacterized protein n=1 Tax=Stentor coeruleus TaxID=5963 RepID=A0A1R2BST7_9CILI|nr:hypothetical protein SteCoe_20207 [Stentor coeruleus]
MSRQRTFFIGKSRRFRCDGLVFQASDTEIQNDLRKMRYAKKPEPIILIQKEVEVELPKKRKSPFEDKKCGIYGLVKLMSTKDYEIQQKKVEKVEENQKIVEETQEITPMINNHIYASYLAMQNQYLRNMMYMPQLNFINGYYNN